MNLGGPELLILVAVAVVLFGAGWLPKAAKNLGKAKVEFDRTQKQLEATKAQVMEATGVKELESTMRKANKVLNTSPKGLLKGAAASAAKPGSQAEAADNGPSDSDSSGNDLNDQAAEAAEVTVDPSTGSSKNLNVDFSQDS